MLCLLLLYVEIAAIIQLSHEKTEQKYTKQLTKVLQLMITSLCLKSNIQMTC